MAAVLQHRDTEKRVCLGGAAMLAAGVWLTELLRLLEKPLFSRVYYGNLNGVFLGVISALLIFPLAAMVHKRVKKRTGLTPFGAHPPMALGRRAVLYLMTVAPILLVSALLGFRFKLVYELGDRVSKMSMLGNAAGYLRAAAILFAAVYAVFLTERAFAPWQEKHPLFPVGAVASLVLFGVPAWLADPSALSPVYFALFFYLGILYRVSQKRFAVTFALSLVLYIL